MPDSHSMNSKNGKPSLLYRVLMFRSRCRTCLSCKRDRHRPSVVSLAEYNQKQVDAIQAHKWIESQKANRDLGEEAVKDWIRKYAKSFREAHGLEENPACRSFAARLASKVRVWMERSKRKKQYHER